MREKPGENVSIHATLDNIERLVSLQVENVRRMAARLAEAQEGLVRAVGCVRDLAGTAVGVAQKVQLAPLAAENDLHPAARGISLLAGIVRQLNGLSNTVEATVGTQAATARELIGIVGEAVKASADLAGKTAALAEGVRIGLPALNNQRLVEAELEWLTGELQKVATTSQCRSKNVSETPSGVTPEAPSRLPFAN